MSIENQRDLDKLKAIGRIVALTMQKMASALEPGITTRELDAIGAAFMRQQGARPAPPLAYKFPGSTCISINEEVAHGIPGDRKVQAGDLVNIDVSAELNGVYADTGASFPVPPVSPETQFLCDSTQEALERALEVVRAGEKINTIGRAVERISSKTGLRIIRELGGHGVGWSLHEEPRHIPNYYTNRAKQRLAKGTVLTIEPFLTPGTGKVYQSKDGWTLKTIDGSRAAQYEHTVVITDNEPILITAV